MTGTDELLAPEEVRKILERRAAVLARPPQAEEPADAIDALVIRIGGERYGIDIRKIAEVRRLDSVTPVPGIPQVWGGLINLRGVLHPVLDAGRYLGLADVSETADHVVMIQGADMTIGLLVDVVAGLRHLRRDEISPPIAADAQAHRQAVSGVTSDLLLLLDVDTLFGDPVLVVEQSS